MPLLLRRGVQSLLDPTIGSRVLHESINEGQAITAGAKAHAMLCTRCGGLLIIDDFMDLQQESSRMRSQGYRCVNCGCIEDPTIRANRQRALSAKHFGLSDVSRNGRKGSVESLSSDGGVDERRCHVFDCED